MAKKLKDKILIFLKGPRWTPNDVDHLDPVFTTDNNGLREKPEFNF